MLNSSNSSVANPLPLGFSCFALTVLAFSYPQWTGAGLVGTTPTLYFVGGLGMLIAGFFAFQRRDTLGATWLTAYGVLWPSTGLYLWAFSATATDMASIVAWWAVAWGIFTAAIVVLSNRAKRPFATLSLLLFFVMFVFVWLGFAFNVPNAGKIAGIAGVLTAILAAIEAFQLLSAATTEAA